ncbi:MAG: TetR/AcrR family transcriptional regulator, partial [Pseudomonadota bacterium]
MSTEEKIQAPADQSGRRTEIIEISTQLFLERGFSGTSMSQLAEACGIRKASFYHHFRSKDELFIACVINGYEGALGRVELLAKAPDLSAEERLSRAFDLLYDVTVHSPAGRLSPIIAEVSRSMPELSKRFYDEYISKQRAGVESIIDIGVGSGVFRKPDPGVLYHLVFGPIVMLSLSHEMFTSMPDLDILLPAEKLKAGHLEATLMYL